MPHPIADIGTPILACLGALGAITVRSFPAGAYVSGYWSQGAPVETPPTAVVQPSTPKEVEQLPEEERTKEAITVYTRNPLKTSDVSSQDQSDVILWDGREWKVMISEDWTAQAMYSRSVATRVGV